ncbi:2-phosphosulfolactate phosphatase [Dysgonomonas massiliensis]|uniref:2-phosphosulfolactate phosphatase n=1 Tax=Dysgonomonas massiliensis TaxID=2040292 RepID=UPI000C794B56|nr:2-phosphosulfolactate phosphatase [Dysgonomonas massiliensis]
MKIDVCFSPALYSFYTDGKDKIVVVVDIFRASTTMCTALNNGAKSIIPVASIDEAQEYKSKGYLVGAERNVKRCDFADFGNSPFDYTAEIVADKDVVFTTTNGTQAIDQASDSYCLLVGAFSNISAIADFCAEEKKDVIVLCAGWNNRFNIEDSLYGGALADLLISKGYESSSDATTIALQMWEKAKPDIRKYMDETEHIKRLEANNLLRDAEYCLELDTVNVVPIFDKSTRKLTIYKP